MGCYMITHSLLSSWLYSMKENPHVDAAIEPEDPMAEFLPVLRREPTPTTDAMQKGIDFENLVTDIVFNRGDRSNKWFDAANKVAKIVRGGVLQCRSKRIIQVDGMQILLYGRLDCLKAGEIFDVKFSPKYERGKYIDSTQHPTYLEIVPEAIRFTYLVSNGTDVWRETYRRDETRDICPIIVDFLSWLRTVDLLGLYKEKWQAL